MSPIFTREAVTSAKVVVLRNLRNLRRDKCFRILADVCLDGRALSERLIDAGLAVKYKGGKKQSWCS